MKITVFSTWQNVTADNRLDVESKNKKKCDAASDIQNSLVAIENNFSRLHDDVEILVYLKDGEILWKFESEVAEEIKEEIRTRVKNITTKISFRS